ncbi:MAG: hypothetical protein ACFCVB_18330 [Nodosilinea sp.]
MNSSDFKCNLRALAKRDRHIRSDLEPLREHRYSMAKTPVSSSLL